MVSPTLTSHTSQPHDIRTIPRIRQRYGYNVSEEPINRHLLATSWMSSHFVNHPTDIIQTLNDRDSGSDDTSRSLGWYLCQGALEITGSATGGEPLGDSDDVSSCDITRIRTRHGLLRVISNFIPLQQDWNPLQVK